MLVEDWDHPEWQCEVSLKITLTDVNDNPPKFTHKSYTATTPEDAPLNYVVAKIHASDPDLGN